MNFNFFCIFQNNDEIIQYFTQGVISTLFVQRQRECLKYGIRVKSNHSKTVFKTRGEGGKGACHCSLWRFQNRTFLPVAGSTMSMARLFLPVPWTICDAPSSWGRRHWSLPSRAIGTTSPPAEVRSSPAPGVDGNGGVSPTLGAWKTRDTSGYDMVITYYVLSRERRRSRRRDIFT